MKNFSLLIETLICIWMWWKILQIKRKMVRFNKSHVQCHVCRKNLFIREKSIELTGAYTDFVFVCFNPVCEVYGRTSFEMYPVLSHDTGVYGKRAKPEDPIRYNHQDKCIKLSL